MHQQPQQGRKLCSCTFSLRLGFWNRSGFRQLTVVGTYTHGLTFSFSWLFDTLFLLRNTKDRNAGASDETPRSAVVDAAQCTSGRSFCCTYTGADHTGSHEPEIALRRVELLLGEGHRLAGASRANSTVVIEATAGLFSLTYANILMSPVSKRSRAPFRQ
jgi:hypothetical protein